MTNPVPITMPEMERLAHSFAKSGLFGIRTSDQALSLMAIAQAEGMHPAIAARDYHIIQGKPALKADAMLARFQNNGGKVEWHEYTDQRVAATFSHPSGGSVIIDWDMPRAKAAHLGARDIWKTYPRQMLRARVISEGIRTVFPGIAVGMYTPEEVQDFDERPMRTKSIDVVPKNVTIEDISPPKVELRQAKIAAPINPATGDATPQMLAVPVKKDGETADWLSWALGYAEALKLAADNVAFEQWVVLNFDHLGSIYHAAPKLHKKLLLTIEKRRKELAPVDAKEAEEVQAA